MEADNLFQSVMKGEWQEVVGTYTTNEVPKLKITASEDTALHLAVRFAPTKVVLKLVETLGENAPEILKIKNKKGNTALHLAAAIGDMKMCHCMATKYRLLIKDKNNEGETPLFLSAFHGKENAFSCLDFHFKETKDNDYSLCTKTIGQDTILHSAIFQEHFSLAIRITEAYPHLVNSPNGSGLSPLHILASKPNAFRRSSSSLGWFDTFIYQCLSSSDEKKEAQEYQQAHELRQTEAQSRHPENIQLHTTSFFERTTTFLGWLRGMIKCIDEENPQIGDTLSEGAGTSSLAINPETHNQVEELPVDQNPSNTKGGRNNFVFFGALSARVSLLPWIFTFLLQIIMKQVILPGIWRIKNLKEMKKRHKMAIRLLNELVKSYSIYMSKTTPIEANPPQENLTEANLLQENLNLTEANLPQENLAEANPLQENLAFPQENLAEANPQENLAEVNPPQENLIEANPPQENLAEANRPQENLVEANHLQENLTLHQENLAETNPPQENLVEANPPQENLAPPQENLTEANPSQENLPNNGPPAATATATATTTATAMTSATATAIATATATAPIPAPKPILIAAKMGVVEVVEKILVEFPMAFLDLDSGHKNVVLIAAENKQPKVYELLIKKKPLNENMFSQLDKDGNSALHLAATFNKKRSSHFLQAASQMRWEVLWYQFVKHSMPPYFFALQNKEGKTPEEIFTNTHEKLVKSSSAWLVKTSESCSVVGALIAAVSFETSATVPGNINSRKGVPIHVTETQFDILTISSLLALCFSVVALFHFLAIRTSSFKEKDFAVDLPLKLFYGFISLLAALASIFISVCSRHYLIVDDKMKSVALAIYIATALTLIRYAIAELPSYFGLLIFNF